MLRRLLISCCSLSLVLPSPAVSDDLGRLFGTIAGEIVKDQLRQQRSQPQRQQPQVRQQPQARQPARQQAQPQQRQRAAQPSAPPPQQPAMSLAERMAVQRALAIAGHYAGEVDGILGSGSRRAIAAWQAAMGAAATGYLLPQQAANLVAMAPPADPIAMPADMAQQSIQPLVAATDDAVPAVPDPQAPAVAASSDGVMSDDELTDQLTLWVAANQPDLLNGQGMAYEVMRMGIAPAIRTQKISDPALQREALLAALPSPAEAPAPGRVVLERGGVKVTPAWNGQPASLYLGGTDIGGTPAITELVAGRRGGQLRWELKSDRPFFTPPPEGFESWAITDRNDKSELLIQVDMTLSDHRPDVTPIDKWYKGGSARMAIHRVTVIRRPPPPRQAAQPRGPDEVLHVWTGEAPAVATASLAPGVDGIVEMFGGAASDGRFALAGVPMREPHYDSRVRYDGTVEPLATALALRQLAEAAPDRLPDVTLTDALASQFLSERERLELFPAEIALRDPSEKISEVALHAAMTENAAAVRDKVIALAPEMPIPMRRVSEAYLGEYDFSTGGFPIQLGASVYRDLPFAQQGPDVSLDTTLKMGPTEGQALLDRMQRVNPAGGAGRQVFIVVDYTLTDMGARAPGSGPITAAELATVTPRSRIDGAALYIDPGLTDNVMDLPVPDSGGVTAEAGPSADEPGDALYQTTGLSLWGAAVKADNQGELSMAMIAGMPAVYGGGGNVIERAQAKAAEMLAAAKDSYWIGAQIDLGAYDAATGSFPITGINLRPIPYDNDISGIKPPAVVPADPRDLQSLRVTTEEAAAIDSFIGERRRLASYLLIRPGGLVDDPEYGPALTLSRPEVALLGPDTEGNGLPGQVLLRIAMQEPPRLDTAAPAGGTAPAMTRPDGLVLDQEGIDLLALSLDPEIYDDAGWRRMLIQRLMKERWFAMADDAVRGPLPWGAFFANPQLTPQDDVIADLLPSFRDWTMARIAVLPDDLLMPYGTVPQSVCQGLLDVTAQQAEADYRFILINAQTLLGDGLTVPQGMPEGYSDTPRARSDQVWAFDSAPKHAPCRYPSAVGEIELADLLPPDAGHSAALIHAAAVPGLGAAGSDSTGQMFRLKPADLRLERPEGEGDIPPGLRAVVVAAATVAGVAAYRTGRSGKGTEQTLNLKPQDWAAPVAAQLAADDVVGLRLGTPLADFEASARAHLGEAILFTEDTPGKGMFGHAHGLLNLETGEAVAAIYAPHAEGQPVVAIMRRVSLPASQANMEAVKQSLVLKYGAISREAFDGAWLWGTLPEDEDGWGVCGGNSLLGSPEQEHAPVLRPTQDLGQPQGSYQNRPEFWFESGWPEIVFDRPGQLEPARCGPVVGALLSDHPHGGKLLQVWLVDRKLAGEIDSVEKPETAAADIKL